MCGELKRQGECLFRCNRVESWHEETGGLLIKEKK
jgi:hypothetical protein